VPVSLSLVAMIVVLHERRQVSANRQNIPAGILVD
jgi:hypothetical protein